MFLIVEWKFIIIENNQKLFNLDNFEFIRI